MRDWPSLKRPIVAPKQLLVEGRTPEIFFREWVQALGIPVEVRDYGSIHDLTDYLAALKGRPEFQGGVNSLAIVRDAEENPAGAAFDSVCASLRAAGIECPAAMGMFGSAVPKAGVYILPDCKQPGMLETLCWSVLEANERHATQVKCVKEYLTCVRGANVQIENESKAKVWSYLAGLGKFDPQVGRAAQNSVWDWNSPVLAHLATFLKTL